MSGLAHANANALPYVLIFYILCIWIAWRVDTLGAAHALCPLFRNMVLNGDTLEAAHALYPSSGTIALRGDTLEAVHALYPSSGIIALRGDIRSGALSPAAAANERGAVSRAAVALSASLTPIPHGTPTTEQPTTAAVASSMYYNNYAVTRTESYSSTSAAMASSAAIVSSNAAIALSKAAVVSSNAVTGILDASSMSYNNYADNRNESYSSSNVAIASSAAMISSNTAIDGTGTQKDANDNGDGRDVLLATATATTVRHTHSYHTHSIDLQMTQIVSSASSIALRIASSALAPIQRAHVSNDNTEILLAQNRDIYGNNNADGRERGGFLLASSVYPAVAPYPAAEISLICYNNMANGRASFVSSIAPVHRGALFQVAPSSMARMPEASNNNNKFIDISAVAATATPKDALLPSVSSLVLLATYSTASVASSSASPPIPDTQLCQDNEEDAQQKMMMTDFEILLFM